MDSQSRAGGRVLVIDGDALSAGIIEACLAEADCATWLSPTPGQAISQLEHRQFDLLIWRVEAASGDMEARRQALFEIRLRTRTPLIVIDEAAAAQALLEAGADQWLPCVSPPGAIVGSVRAALRKSTPSGAPINERVEIRGMVFDGRTRRLSYRDGGVVLTRQEWELLSLLVSHANRFLSAREIVRLGWRGGDHEVEQLRTYIRRLRQRLAPLGAPCQLVSEHGRGYCLAFDEDSAAGIAPGVL